ncbi:pyruvate kinase [Fragilariopsis cylindrus CCMP1102]|uniref:Pyruvate kinase n=1 Tax=Fragilariopsis cylindrus CCMP1102 TaxID=635003 RepID=A0A1E7ETJ0_9STRA|nr:pyruvate kinase [Fragilariopsis cylindrus CCMP1102]|eukprot:OEU09192.1 pyruvate kinase [Fragilariopsis cylindrus CCMP1102]
MKISATALALAIVSSTVATTSVFAFTTSNAFATTRTTGGSSSPPNTLKKTDTSLYNGMAAYDAQMKAAAAAANGIAATVPVPPPVGFTKQLATLGPASSSFEMIEKLFLAGADVFRLNFSHGEHPQKKELLDIIRAVEQKHDHPIAILGDLQGPKLRVGQFANPEGEHLPVGHVIRFDLDPTLGNAQRVMLPHPEIIEASEIGHALLIDDGKVKVRVTAKGPGYLDCTVEVPGKIKDKKGVNTPDSILQISCLTPKDLIDLQYMLEIGVDWIALSFVQRPEDIVEISRLILDYNVKHGTHRPHVMAKIEKPSCFDGDSLERIVELCDGIMVARGDLGVECAPEDVPILQKQIIDECREQGKPVVVATQMLESMIDSPTPTRAEASDVATAIYDGADAIMLSAESAAGDFPEESVLMQQRIINRVEGDPHYDRYLQSFEPHHLLDSSSASAIIVAARQIARTVDAKAIVSFTVGGSTALKASQSRPGAPILAISPVIETSRQLSLSWGIYSEYATDHGDYDSDNFRDMLRAACEIANRKGLVEDPNDLLVVTAGFPFGTPGASNIIRVIPAAGPSHWDASL